MTCVAGFVQLRVHTQACVGGENVKGQQEILPEIEHLACLTREGKSLDISPGKS